VSGFQNVTHALKSFLTHELGARPVLSFTVLLQPIKKASGHEDHEYIFIVKP
jgi:hypothetical protein